MGAALVWFLAREKAGRSALPPLLLMVLAGFWKHNIIAIPAAAVLRGYACATGALLHGLVLISGGAAAAGARPLRRCSSTSALRQSASLLAPIRWGIW